MIDKATLFEISRLIHLGWSDRRIARHLWLDRTTVKKYRQNPDRRFKAPAQRGSKLDRYRHLVDQWLEGHRGASAAARQRLRRKDHHC